MIHFGFGLEPVVQIAAVSVPAVDIAMIGPLADHPIPKLGIELVARALYEWLIRYLAAAVVWRIDTIRAALTGTTHR